MTEELDQAEEGMEKALKALDHEFAALRTGRASVSQLEQVKVDYYGVATPIPQVAAVKVPEAHMMTIEPWDKSIIGDIEKAIIASNLGVTPNNDGKGVLHLPFPAPTEERRKELVKECRSVAEKARVGVRGARKDAKNKIDRLKKDGEISEDEQHRLEGQLQDLTDRYVAKVDAALAEKEADVMEI